MELSQQLKKIREDRNLSQGELASRSGVSQSFVSSIEAGNKTPTISTMKKICNGLGLSLAEFFSDDSDQIPDYLTPLLEEGRHMTPEQSQKLADFLNSLRQQ